MGIACGQETSQQNGGNLSAFLSAACCLLPAAYCLLAAVSGMLCGMLCGQETSHQNWGTLHTLTCTYAPVNTRAHSKSNTHTCARRHRHKHDLTTVSLSCFSFVQAPSRSPRIATWTPSPAKLSFLRHDSSSAQPL
jgi:hypothetical protein